jgi:hypothetical protein
MKAYERSEGGVAVELKTRHNVFTKLASALAHYGNMDVDLPSSSTLLLFSAVG